MKKSFSNLETYLVALLYKVLETFLQREIISIHVDCSSPLLQHINPKCKMMGRY
jgi:hypothetical protein